jgi:hypothetical protein
MQKTQRRNLCIAGLALASGGCLSVEAEVDEMQVTRHALAFEGTARGSPDVHSSVEAGFTHPHFPLDLPDGFVGDIRATQVALVPTEGSPDLDFIRRLELTLSKNRLPRLLRCSPMGALSGPPPSAIWSCR